MLVDKIPLPWRIKQALLWLIVNRHASLLLLRTCFKPPKRRIMISSAFFGGVGGVEKLLKSVIESMPEALFYIMAREVRTEGFVPETRNYLLNSLPSRDAPIDLYLYFAGGGRPAYLGDQYTIKTRVIDTCGANIRDIESKFDWVVIQTGNHANYCSQQVKCIQAFPDVPATFPKGRKQVDLPERYFLTVFNPFSNTFKGYESLLRAADAAVFPIVWCYSENNGFDFSHIPDHPNVLKLKNISQEELYFAYEHANAYVSFSHMESFGWSLAEAFYCDLPIISRAVGFMTYVAEQPGIHIYQSEEELRRLLGNPSYQRRKHDDSLFQEHRFPAIIERLLSSSDRPRP